MAPTPLQRGRESPNRLPPSPCCLTMCHPGLAEHLCVAVLKQAKVGGDHASSIHKAASLLRSIMRRPVPLCTVALRRDSSSCLSYYGQRGITPHWPRQRWRGHDAPHPRRLHAAGETSSDLRNYTVSAAADTPHLKSECVREHRSGLDLDTDCIYALLQLRFFVMVWMIDVLFLPTRLSLVCIDFLE